MREYRISANDAGQRVDRFLAKACPGTAPSLLQKAIRTKNVKRNGRRAKADERLEEGDVVRLYLKEEQLAPAREDESWRSISQPKLRILYEDEDLLLLDKPKGMLTQPDGRESRETLSSHLKAALYLRGDWNPEAENTFAPALCNRIDRNTQGIVIAAKNAETLRLLGEKIRRHELTKSYLCIIHGKMLPPEGRLEHYLVKDAQRNQVRVYDHPVPGGLYAGTIYRTLESRGRLSLVECELITGRTHQIRAQFASAGHPLLGDGKYGRERDNRPYGLTSQALFSYKLRFDLPTPAGRLDRLRGKTFSLEKGEFYQEFLAYAQRSMEL